MHKGDMNVTTNNKSKLKVENNHHDENHNISSRAANTSSLSSSNSLSNHNRSLTNPSSENNFKKSEKKNSNFFCGRAQPASIATNSNQSIKYFNKNTIPTKLSTSDVEKSRMPKINKQPSSNGSINSMDDHFSNVSQLSKSNGYLGSSQLNGSQNSTPSDYKLLRRSSVESNATSGYYSNDKKSKNYINSRNLPTTKLSDTNYSNKLKSNINESNYFTSANKLKSHNTLKHCRHSSLDTDDHSAHYHQHNHKKRNSVSDDKLLLGCGISQHHTNLDATNDFSSQIYYESRLKCLEDKIMKHQNDMKTFLNQNPRVRSKMDKSKPLKVLSESKISKSNVRGELERSKSEHNRNDHMTVKYGYAEGDLAKYKTTKRGSNFGVITASDLFKLRSTEMIL